MKSASVTDGRAVRAAAAEMVRRLEAEAEALSRGTLVDDIDGHPWEVHEASVAPGAPVVVVRGWPHPRRGGHASAGGRAVVLTPALAHYLDEHRTEPGVHRAIGISPPTIARLRRHLGGGWLADRAAWWAEREADLATLTVPEFLARHRDDYASYAAEGVRYAAAQLSRTAVQSHRRAVLGAGRLPNGWYERPEMRSLIVSDLSLSDLSEALRLPVAYVKILRYRLRHGRA